MTKAVDINGLTGEVIERDLNDLEIEARKHLATKQKQLEQNEIAKAAARQAVLDRLGLTEQEAQLLLGS